MSNFPLDVLQRLSRRGISRLVRNLVQQGLIHVLQRRALRRSFDHTASRLIVFLVPGGIAINGGVLSISSIYSESHSLNTLHGAIVVMCTVPGEPRILKHTMFPNDHLIYDFIDVLAYFDEATDILIHIPEYAVPTILLSSILQNLRPVVNLTVNVLLQNIDICPSPKAFSALASLGTLTCTTAHRAYSNDDTARRLGVHLKFLSTYISPQNYSRVPYSHKENLMVVSPDSHPRKSEILDSIRRKFPRLQVYVVSKMPYTEFLSLISRAKWALTFGEGLDGYFVETIFSGGIGLAVYNDRYFTKPYQRLRTVYTDWSTLESNIVSDLSYLDSELEYFDAQAEQFEVCSRDYNYQLYQGRIREYYQEHFAKV